ncbi:PAS domain S-box protein [Adhaeribacter radiodurans]|uniref:histidine kinase n=1 Tax=Adhaeribacter radiodurans TaxID=2745197 RepID=A0A7L7L487_9BACT|nr:PAS domain S-box protein [Adhaeribacter radiodurans]QMU27628.1 PAS domain S-box protein [Adhaeribacter radiodurans]
MLDSKFTFHTPQEEKERLHVLHQYEILDTEAEADFDAITKLAAYVCNTPISHISLIDQNCQWFKSAIGMDLTPTPRDTSFCQYTILNDDILEINDAHQDTLFSTYPSVLGDPHIRFYAGAPLISPGGYRIGALCVIDSTPKTLNDAQRHALQTLAREVVSHLELRRHRKNLELENNRLHLYQMLFNYSSEMMCIIDINTKRLLEVNAAFESIMGYSAHDLIGNSIDEFIHPDDKSHWMDLLEELPYHKAVESETRYFAKDGTIRWLSWNAQAVNGKLFAIARDITKLRRTGSENLNLEHLLIHVLDNSPSGICAFRSIRNKAGEILDFEWTMLNHATENIIGKKANELIGQSVSSLAGPVNTEIVLPLFKQVIEENLPLYQDQVFFDLEGKKHWLQLIANKLEDGLILILNNISERKLGEEKLEQQRTFYESILNNIPSDIAVLDQQQRYMFLNPMAVKDPEVRAWMIGKNDREYCTYRNRDIQIAYQREQAFNQAICEKQIVHWEDVSVKANQKPKYHLRRFNPIFDQTGNLQFVIGYGFDITDRKEMETELHYQKELVQQVIDTNPNLIYLKDNAGKFTLVNRAFANFLGFPADYLIGRTSQEFESTPEEAALSLEQDRQVLETGQTVEINEMHVISSQDGKRSCYHLLKVPFIQKDNQAQVLCIATDITEAKKAEHKLLENRNLLNESQQIAHLGSWSINLKTEEVVWSEEAFRISGFEPREKALSMEEYLTILHPDDVPLLIEKLELAITEHQSYAIELRLILPSGNLRYTCVLGRIEFDEVGQPSRLLGTVQDITDRKQIEQELIKAKEQAEELVRAKEMFLSTMSHEIRTPLNAVIGISHLLLQENPKSEQIENLKILRLSSENLLVLINDILDYSKIEAGKISFEKIDFNLSELIKNIRHSFGYQANEKDLKIRACLDNTLPAVIAGDPVRLNQIISNLLSNAIKFTAQGTITIDVILERETADQIEISFSVTDTGIGIPADKLDLIFESFTQAQSDTTRKFGGTGLGLTITKRLVELQGGRITVESTEAKGSTFTVTLAFTKRLQQVAPPDLYYATGTFQNLDHLRLLLVEDNEINQLVATRFLENWGITPDCAINGKIAVEKVQQQPYDIILMDLQMPVMDGFEATQLIRKMGGRNAEVPIIALTANVMPDARQKALQVGMNDFVSKPIDPAELHLKISKHTQSEILSKI